MAEFRHPPPVPNLSQLEWAAGGRQLLEQYLRKLRDGAKGLPGVLSPIGDEGDVLTVVGGDLAWAAPAVGGGSLAQNIMSRVSLRF